MSARYGRLREGGGARRGGVRCRVRAWGLALGVLLAGATTAAAQDGWYHVDDHHPLRVEDAYALKLYEWEWQFVAEAAGGEGDARAFGGILELKTGLGRNLQTGLELHAASESVDGSAIGGIEEFSTHFLYNLNEQGRRSPAVGVRVDVVFPGSGDVRRQRRGARTAVLVTRTIGPLRTHVNAGRAFAAKVDGGDTWVAGLALERALGLSSRSILADVFTEIPVGGGRSTVWLDLGARLQVTRRSVLAVGAFARVDGPGSEGPRAGLRIGWTRAFGIRALTPVPPYPAPRIR